MELYDVIVIGAGPSGATAARVMAHAGLDVLVIEKETFPREKPCAGWISPLVFELSGVSPDIYSRENTLASFSSLIVWDNRDVPREVAFTRTMGYGIIRSQFDQALVSMIGDAKLLMGVRVESVERDNEGIIINDSFRAPVVIGAGGHFCPVAREFEEINTDEKKVVAVVSETRIKKDILKRYTPYPDTPEIIFNNDFTGYGWYFQKGEYLNIGVGTTSVNSLKAHRDLLLERLNRKGRLPDKDAFDISGFSGHAYKLYKLSSRNMVSDSVILVGDAAGIAYNMSGEGIGPAIFSGLTAAQTINDAGGDFSEESLLKYQKRIISRFGRPYSRRLTSILSSLPPWIISIIRKMAIGIPLSRREIIAKRWFFRD